MRTGLILVAYPLFQLILRLVVSEGLEYDEAEQVVLTQSLALGYPSVAAQPPLYTWLQYLFFMVFGMNVFALAGLRALLQVLTQVALYRSARLILDNRAVAVLAALSVWLIPQFSVESMRKTHSVLVTCLAAVLLHAILLVWRSGGVATYLWLGTVLGLGVLAKYNFPIVAGALLLAGISVDPLRRCLLDRRLGVGFMVAGFLVAPHLIWLVQHLDTATAQVGRRVGFGTTPEWTIRGAAHSLWVFGEDALGFLPPVALHLTVFGRPRETLSEAAATVASLLERFWLIACGVLIVAVIVISMAKFRAHWLQPFLVFIPLYMFLRPPSANPSPRALTVFAAMLAVAIVLLMGWRVVELWSGHHVRAFSRLNTPYPELGRRLAETGFHGGVIFADHHLVGGNLRFVLQDIPVITRRMAEAGGVVPPGPCLIVWDARKQQEIPRRLIPWVAGSEPTPPARHVEARGRRADRAVFRLGFLQLLDCRRPRAPGRSAEAVLAIGAASASRHPFSPDAGPRR